MKLIGGTKIVHRHTHIQAHTQTYTHTHTHTHAHRLPILCLFFFKKETRLKKTCEPVSTKSPLFRRRRKEPIQENNIVILALQPWLGLGFLRTLLQAHYLWRLSTNSSLASFSHRPLDYSISPSTLRFDISNSPFTLRERDVFILRCVARACGPVALVVFLTY